MFTGIITDVGQVTGVDRTGGDTRFEILCAYPAAGIDLGASICCSGCCLTVIERHAEGAGSRFAVEASAETLNVTALKEWRTGSHINLERALKVGDELGGHIVSGHVDGVGEIVSVSPEGDSQRFVFSVPQQLARYIAPKGSIALDGTSFTVNEVRGCEFGINIIPHTQKVTTWGTAKAGDAVNVEIDMLARYVARLAEFS